MIGKTVTISLEERHGMQETGSPYCHYINPWGNDGKVSVSSGSVYKPRKAQPELTNSEAT